jgi:hypothetical protein
MAVPEGVCLISGSRVSRPASVTLLMFIDRQNEGPDTEECIVAGECRHGEPKDNFSRFHSHEEPKKIRCSRATLRYRHLPSFATPRSRNPLRSKRPTLHPISHNTGDSPRNSTFDLVPLIAGILLSPPFLRCRASGRRRTVCRWASPTSYWVCVRTQA